MKKALYIIITFIASTSFLNIANAAVCTYQNQSDRYGTVQYVCNVTSNDVDCDFRYGGAINSSSIKDTGLDLNIEYNDFLNSDNVIDCSEVPNLFLDQYTNKSNAIVVLGVSKERVCEEHQSAYENGLVMDGTYSEDCTIYTLVNNTPDDDGDSGSLEGVGGEIDEGVETLDNFCSGTVLGAFTTIGWIIFFLKIVIPIIIIVFGVIDLGKAIIASKDDEIKKSIKSLVFRAIAGIIIFFIPTILNFVIQLVDNNSETSLNANGDFKNDGSFLDCTYCLLNPNEDECRKLVE